jgi:hypothetical protein
VKNLFVFAPLLFVIALEPLSGQHPSPQSGGMPTVEADLFFRMEKRLADAVVAQNQAALEPLLSTDFELRTARSGGELTLRDEWLQAAVSSYKVRSYRITGVTVRPCGSSAIVNFFYEQQASFAGTDLSGDFFVTDVWEKEGREWHLAARYSAGPVVAPKLPANPKVKE